MNRPLQRNKRAEIRGTVPASGTLTVFVTVPLGPTWEIKQISINIATQSGDDESECSTYIGTNNAGVFISNSFTGNSDTDSEPNVSARSGDSVAAVWTSAPVGRQATLTVIYDEVGY